MNKLDSLKKTTTIVIDSGNIDFINHYKINDVTTNPSLILRVVNTYDKNNLIFNDALIYARKKNGTLKNKIINATDKLIINISMEILKKISGRLSISIDTRLSFNYDLCINKAYKIINLFKEYGIDTSRILIKIPSTWEGIQAAKELEKDGINCNLTLLFSLTQAKACAEANVHIISPFVGRISDWFYKSKNLDLHMKTIDNDPGIVLVKDIFNYYKQCHYKTLIMGASLRNTKQIIALAGCDYLTIIPSLLKELQESYGHIERKLIFSNKVYHKPIPLSEAEFRWEHNQNEMAVNKLSEGIRLFAIDQQRLESILAPQL